MEMLDVQGGRMVACCPAEAAQSALSRARRGRLPSYSSSIRHAWCAVVQGLRLLYDQERATPAEAVRGKACLGVGCQHKSAVGARAAPVGRGVLR